MAAPSKKHAILSEKQLKSKTDWRLVVQRLSKKCEALSSNPSTVKKFYLYFQRTQFWLDDYLYLLSISLISFLIFYYFSLFIQGLISSSFSRSQDRNIHHAFPL
jgi:hypothetical protein